MDKRFTDKYIVNPENGCWLWSASLDSWGYGLLRGVVLGIIFKYSLYMKDTPFWED